MTIKFSENDLIAKNAEFSHKCEFHSKSMSRLWTAPQLLEFTLGLIEEEVKETDTAILTFGQKLNQRKVGEAVGFGVMEEIVDGFCDISVISLNGIYKVARIFGLSHSQSVIFAKMCFEAVLDSNLSKISENGEVLFNDVGKVQKPDTYEKPNFTRAFEYATMRLKELGLGQHV